MLSSGNTCDPRTWNRYSYTLNNPLKYTDPLGLYEWDMSLGGGLTDEQLEDLARRARDFGVDPQRYRDIQDRRNEFRDALRTAAAAASDRDLPMDQRAEILSSVDAYGVEGQDNGVTVGSGNLPLGVGAEATPTGYRRDQSGRVIGGTTRVTIDINTTGNALAGAVAHEGRHIANRAAAIAVWTISGDYETARNSALNLTQYENENRAYHISAYMARSLDMDTLTYTVNRQTYQIWRRGMANVDQQTLNRLIQAHYNVTPASQGPRMLP